MRSIIALCDSITVLPEESTVFCNLFVCSFKSLITSWDFFLLRVFPSSQSPSFLTVPVVLSSFLLFGLLCFLLAFSDHTADVTCALGNWVFLGCLLFSSSLICESIPAASIPPSPPNPGHLIQDESRGVGIWQLIVSRPPMHLQTTKNFLHCILSLFPTALRSLQLSLVKQFQTPLFWNNDHKRPIKTIKTICFVFIWSQCPISWPYPLRDHMTFQVRLMNILYIVHWSDKLGGPGSWPSYLGTGGRGICQRKLPAELGIWPIFSTAQGGGCCGWNWLAHKHDCNSSRETTLWGCFSIPSRCYNYNPPPPKWVIQQVLN